MEESPSSRDPSPGLMGQKETTAPSRSQKEFTQIQPRELPFTTKEAGNAGEWGAVGLSEGGGGNG